MVNDSSTLYGKEGLLCNKFFCVLEASCVVCLVCVCVVCVCDRDPCAYGRRGYFARNGLGFYVHAL